MKNFMLIFRSGSDAMKMSPEESQQNMQQWFSWIGELQSKGIYTGGEALLPTGKTVKKGNLVTDGPYAESKEKVGGGFYCFSNPVSESVLQALYKKMQSGMSWPDAVVAEWDSIESGEDKVILAPHNPNFSPEELKGYQALAKLRKRML